MMMRIMMMRMMKIDRKTGSVITASIAPPDSILDANPGFALKTLDVPVTLNLPWQGTPEPVPSPVHGHLRPIRRQSPDLASSP